MSLKPKQSSFTNVFQKLKSDRTDVDSYNDLNKQLAELENHLFFKIIDQIMEIFDNMNSTNYKNFISDGRKIRSHVEIINATTEDEVPRQLIDKANDLRVRAQELKHTKLSERQQLIDKAARIEQYASRLKFLKVNGKNISNKMIKLGKLSDNDKYKTLLSVHSHLYNNPQDKNQLLGKMKHLYQELSDEFMEIYDLNVLVNTDSACNLGTHFTNVSDEIEQNLNNAFELIRHHEPQYKLNR